MCVPPPQALYGSLFDWLIEKINVALMAKMAAAASASAKEKHLTIGVLDIFGFESFVKNSFEQLCINFCNEKLQFHFNEHIFKLEQQEYESEGITVEHIEFTDNQACLDLLEMKGTGVFAMIDDEINVPRGSDEGFRSKVVQKHGKVRRRGAHTACRPVPPPCWLTFLRVCVCVMSSTVTPPARELLGAARLSGRRAHLVRHPPLRGQGGVQRDQLPGEEQGRVA